MAASTTLAGIVAEEPASSMFTGMITKETPKKSELSRRTALVCVLQFRSTHTAPAVASQVFEDINAWLLRQLRPPPMPSDPRLVKQVPF